ncbi:long-chain fatty acid--CoA ligase [Lysinibacillus sp. NPDC097287]|uniref:long-chain-fatty-acid--CoA ligase n=1 Tax=Lysinibacillus sp. NPDC097287 TaxID=3364144 RepID=UPI003812F5E0
MSKPWHRFYPANVPYEIELSNLSIYDLFERSVEEHPNNKAIINGDEALTYAQLKDQSDCLAAALYHRGFQKGERICVMLPNCKEYAIVTYAIHRLGGVLVQVNPMFQPHELVHIFKDSGAGWLISRQEQQQKIHEIGMADQITMIATDGVDEQTASLYLWIEEGRKQLPPLDIEPKEDIAVLQYTGGTTGRPKGAMLTHFNVVNNFYQNFISFAGVYERSCELSLGIAPLFHGMGMTNMNTAIFTGATYIVVARFEVNKVLELIRQHRPTIIAGSPTMYIALLRHPDLQADDLRSLKICSCGSAPMPVEVINAFERKSGAIIVEGYGLTEATTTVCRNPLTGERKIGSIGIPVSSTDVKIVDLESGTQEVTVGESGELLIKGPQVMKGYWENPEATKRAIQNGWLYTGDIVTMDKDGFLYIVGRKKEMIIAGGYNIYPAEIEEVLYEHPAISEAVVYGIPDTYRGETVKASIVLKPGMSATEEEVIDWCRERLAAYKYPRFVHIRTELPKTPVGKILRRALIEEEKLRLTNN